MGRPIHGSVNGSRPQEASDRDCLAAPLQQPGRVPNQDRLRPQHRLWDAIQHRGGFFIREQCVAQLCKWW